jgi:hypothetical protein
MSAAAVSAARNDVGVDAECDGGVSVAQAGGDDMNRDAGQQQRGGVNVP